jgi:hypothetical protein
MKNQILSIFVMVGSVMLPATAYAACGGYTGEGSSDTQTCFVCNQDAHAKMQGMRVCAAKLAYEKFFFDGKNIIGSVALMNYACGCPNLITFGIPSYLLGESFN